MNRITEFLEVFISMVIAILRLLFLCATLLMSGLQIVIFTRTEVCNLEMKGMPWRCDRQKMNDQLAFVDKMYLENPDLFEGGETNFPPEDTEDGEDGV